MEDVLLLLKVQVLQGTLGKLQREGGPGSESEDGERRSRNGSFEEAVIACCSYLYK